MSEIIKHVDTYTIRDVAKSRSKQFLSSKQRVWHNWVRIYLNDKLVEETQNLVVGLGREFVAQKIFNLVPAGASDWRSYQVSHFAVGQGGGTLDCTVTPPIFTPNGPLGDDEQLYSPINLGNTSYLTEPGGVQYACKPITTDGSIQFNQVTIESKNYYTEIVCTCVVAAGEPTSLADGESIMINEAGLYFVSGTDAKMFAHVTFAPKWKEKESTLTIEWTILT